MCALYTLFVNVIIRVSHSNLPYHCRCAVLPPLWAFCVCAVRLSTPHHQCQETTEQFKLLAGYNTGLRKLKAEGRVGEGYYEVVCLLYTSDI